MAFSKPLIIRDEIHGDISLDAVARSAVDHPSFQRLRHIKQLGLAEYVFPCATHTRFQHSLGAAYLAKQYFESIIETWPEWEFDYQGRVDTTEFLTDTTREVITTVAAHGPSRQYWCSVATLAGMLHDVGHGPWSHTFEYLDLTLDLSAPISQLSGPVREYFDELVPRAVRHEDLSVLYLFEILQDLESKKKVPDALGFFLPVAVLINARLLKGDFAAKVNAAVETLLDERRVEGGMQMLRLLAPMISGPFDVDRADYIQRDARNSGVSIGGIEWRRIVRKLMPCLARHDNRADEPRDVVLVSHLKNQYVLDDFIFSLFQMYAQVYLHPKIVGFEEQVRRELDRAPKTGKPKISFELHSTLSDESFRLWLEKEWGAAGINKTLTRGARFQVVGLPPGRGQEAGLSAAGYFKVDTHDRPVMKDRMGVFLFSPAGPPGQGKGGSPVVMPWTEASAMAKSFFDIKHCLEIWIRPEA